MIVTEVKIAFGRGSDGRMVGIDEVSRGKECHCTCPECEHPLIAVHGEKVRHHFRHDPEYSQVRICAITPESAIHKLAKQIICEAPKLGLPDPLGSMSNPIPEYWLDGIRPDVYATFGSEPVAIEIRVAHKVDDAKIKTYNERRLAAVEIDLSDYRDDDNLTAKRIKELVLYVAQRKWLSPPQEIRRQREAAAAFALAEQDRRRRQVEAQRIAQLMAERRRQEELETIELRRQEKIHRMETELRRKSEKMEIADALEWERQVMHADRWGTHRLMAEGRKVMR